MYFYSVSPFLYVHTSAKIRLVLVVSLYVYVRWLGCALAGKYGGSLGGVVALWVVWWLFGRCVGSLRGLVPLWEMLWLFGRCGGSLGGVVALLEDCGSVVV